MSACMSGTRGSGVLSSTGDMSNMRNDISYDIDKYCIKQEDDEIFAHTHNISIYDVRVAIKHLKKCKSDCIDGIFSDNFINGT